MFCSVSLHFFFLVRHNVALKFSDLSKAKEQVFFSFNVLHVSENKKYK